MLARDIRRITWLDADLMVTADLSGYFRYLSDDTILVAQEGFRSRHAGTGGRTIAIGQPIARELGYTVNSYRAAPAALGALEIPAALGPLPDR